MSAHDPARRKTSITQLLNPLVDKPQHRPDHPHPQSRPAFSPPIHFASFHHQLPHQHATSHLRTGTSTQFGLRAVDWDNSVDPRPVQDDDDEQLGSEVAFDDETHSIPIWNSQRPYHAPSTMGPWAGERTDLSTNQMAFHPHLIPMGYQGLHAELQPAERASTRLAARGSGTQPSPEPPETNQAVSRHKRSRKSTEADGDGQAGSAGPSKPKKVRTKPRTVNNGAKKGYPARKRSEAAQLAATAAQHMVPLVSYSPVSGKGKEPALGQVKMSFVRDPGSDLPIPVGTVIAELQFARCMSNRYKSDDFPRCVSCTRRWAGDTCRFQGIRYLVRNEKRHLIAVSFAETQFATSPLMVLPTTWNVDLQPYHLDLTMRTVAKALLPHLKMEQEHMSRKEVVRRPRETEVRATCDTCMTSLFSNSWMCRQCGREACPDCYSIVRDLTEDPPGLSQAAMAELQTKRDKYAQTNPFFLSCTRRNEHGTAFFSPVSRFSGTELDEAASEMEALVGPPIGPLRPPSGLLKTESTDDTDAITGRNPIEDALPSGGPVDAGASINQKSGKPPLEAPPGGYFIEEPMPPGAPVPNAPSVPSWPVLYFADAELSEEAFRERWSLGEPLVVTGLSPKFQINWTPDYFIEKYNAQSCLILECQTDVNKRVTVGEFFSHFGKYEGRTEEWKLKDWPPTTDFKTAFPELFDDFVRAVPVPAYTRRDGAMNIASHFPSNTVAPDLGPKMYNAFASTEAPGSKGSTRLHMDMANAVNIMLHSSARPDGSPGCAVWDVFRAEDSSILRRFLRKQFRGAYQNDPIHAQLFYLDSSLRQKLFKEYGVKSWRIYQQPGEAVFIPAGCAHQVCNLADCIKVACDFVSPENIERCEALTQEFRDQNQSLVWKEDVLQLRTMMWFAWVSCRLLQKKKNDSD